uniref:Imidazoleglycerol-phosphate dehydratase n=2 Tax=Phaseolus vulgaris TaxID=3885 RepID=V7BCG1_PHAVU|nr:hypothetical protein PHAVU_007G057200g [Phaseolus vulgaris]ESW15250.1 hypothetical protein PHAVU_007G057200g [Phaseolus vulgaris]
MGLTFFLPKSSQVFLWTKITLGEDRRGAAVVATLSMELSAARSFPASPSSPLLNSRVRVFNAIPNPTPSPFQASILSLNPRKLTPMDLTRNVFSAAVVGDNDSATTTLPIDSGARIGEVKRVTKETNVSVKINLDGSGVADSSSGIPFLDHMLDQLASHGLFDVHVKATGDIHIDDHHTNEDVALAIGTALLQALGDRKGINRFGDFSAPLDEALIHVSLDLSGRPYLGYNLDIPTQRVGTYDTQLVEHFFQSLVNTSGMTLHIRQLAGKNSHHIIEATFKAFARALRQATEYDPRRLGTVPSSKGVLSRS